MRKNIAVFFGLFILFLLGCGDSSDFVFDEKDTQYIQVEASIIRSFDDGSPRLKSDTIMPGDTLIFFSEISPSKAIRSTKMYWTLDGSIVANEFTFKDAIKDPGIHKMVFVFVDNFGDISSDTLTLYVATPPAIDQTHLIPANGTQNLNPQEPMNFSWTGLDSDNFGELDYKFILREAALGVSETTAILVDTNLKESYYTYQNKLSPLTKYRWEVSVKNNLQQEADYIAASSFFTQGVPGENAILATVKSSSTEIPSSLQVVVKDSVSNIIKDETVKLRNGAESFYIKPLPSGRISVDVFVLDHPDFIPATRMLQLAGDQVFEIENLYLLDTIPPTIKSFTNADSLDFADTILVQIQEGGTKLQPSKISVILDDRYINTLKFSSDTLSIILPQDKFWTHRILTVIAVDASANKSRRSFYLRPNTTLEEVLP